MAVFSLWRLQHNVKFIVFGKKKTNNHEWRTDIVLKKKPLTRKTGDQQNKDIKIHSHALHCSCGTDDAQHVTVILLFQVPLPFVCV